jgi:hypothetical protein
MSTTIRTSDQIIGHLFQTYAAHEQLLGHLGGLDKLCAMCGERIIFVVKFVLQARRMENTIESIVAARGWNRWKCAN